MLRRAMMRFKRELEGRIGRRLRRQHGRQGIWWLTRLQGTKRKPRREEPDVANIAKDFGVF